MRSGWTLLFLVWVACLSYVIQAQELPRHTDPWQVRASDEHTLLLWNFEDGLKDASGRGNDAQLMGSGRPTPQGRFGGAIQLAGGNSGLRAAGVAGLDARQLRRGLSFDFWIHIDAPPRGVACILEVASNRDEPVLRLDMRPDGRVLLRGMGLPDEVSEQPLPVDRWVHLAIHGYDQYEPNNTWIESSGVRVLLDGHPLVTSLTQRSYNFPPNQVSNNFVLGNSVAGNAGLACRLDEVEVSAMNRTYIADAQQPHVRPDAGPITREAAFFRNHEPVFSQAFDRPVQLAGRGQAEPVEGVRGQGIRITGASEGMTIPLPSNMDLTRGTLEFWFRPADWDNLRPWQPNFNLNDHRLPLVSLRARTADGRETNLVTTRASQLAGEDRKDKHLWSFELTPRQWRHMVIAWGEGYTNAQPHVYLDGKLLTWSDRQRVASPVRETDAAGARAVSLVLGNARSTVFDAIRIYDYDFRPEEAANAWASYTGDEMKALPPALAKFDYRMTIGRMTVNLDVMKKDPSVVTGAQLRFQLPDRTITAPIPSFTNGKGAATFEVGQLPEGDYTCNVVLQNRAGRALDTFDVTFTRKALPWLGNRLGILDTPPPPFTPLTASGNKVQAIGREYQVGSDGLFESIQVKGEEILASPIKVEVVRDGRPVTLRSGFQAAGVPHQPAAPSGAAMGKVTPVEVPWEGMLSGGGLSVQSQAAMDYDGMTKFTVTIRPSGGAVPVDEMTLRIPLREQFANYLHALPLGGGLRQYETSIRLSDEDGPLWDSKSGFHRRGAFMPTVGSFIPLLWLSGNERGLCWFADNDKGWAPNDDHPAITVVRKDGVVWLNLHWISSPTRIDRPRTIVFGLLPTPSKPVGNDYRLWERGNTDQVGIVGGRVTSTDWFRLWYHPPRDHGFEMWPRDYDWDYARMAADTQRQRQGASFPLMLYLNRSYGPSGKDGEYFEWEWKTDPDIEVPQQVRTWVWTFPPSQVDWMCWYIDKWYEIGIDGVYFDDIFPNPSYNTATGVGYELEDGRIQPGSPFFGFREYIKRIRGIAHSHGRRPIIVMHTSHVVPMSALSFADVIYDGEDSGRFTSTRRDFMDMWPLERFRMLNDHHNTGLATVFMFKHAYAQRPSRNPHHLRATWRAAYAAWLLHDLWLGPLRSNSIGPGTPVTMRAIEDYKGDRVRFHPYWRNEQMVQVAPVDSSAFTREHLPSTVSTAHWSQAYLDDLAQNPLKAAVYVRPDGRAMLAVVNYARVPLQARVTYSPSALGVRSNATVTDIDDMPMTDPSVPVPDGVAKPWPTHERELQLSTQPGEITLMVGPHDFRLLELR